jgi:hypothetical protein
MQVSYRQRKEADSRVSRTNMNPGAVSPCKIKGMLRLTFAVDMEELCITHFDLRSEAVQSFCNCHVATPWNDTIQRISGKTLRYHTWLFMIPFVSLVKEYS